MEAIRARFYEYQDFMAMRTRWLAALDRRFELHRVSSEEVSVPIRPQFSPSELTKTEKETMDAVRLAGLQGSHGWRGAGAR